LRILADTCVHGDVKSHLAAAGHDVVWAGDWDHDPGDEKILAWAARHGRILITIDKDFGTLAVLRRKRHRGIVRLVTLPLDQMVQRCLQVLEKHGAALADGALITVTADRIRVRPAD
jgi:predicted nuclease of predicted toxin-antitoxin system